MIPQIKFFGVCLLPPLYEIIETGGINVVVESVSCIQETILMIFFNPIYINIYKVQFLFIVSFLGNCGSKRGLIFVWKRYLYT